MQVSLQSTKIQKQILSEKDSFTGYTKEITNDRNYYLQQKIASVYGQNKDLIGGVYENKSNYILRENTANIGENVKNEMNQMM